MTDSLEQFRQVKLYKYQTTLKKETETTSRAFFFSLGKNTKRLGETIKNPWEIMRNRRKGKTLFLKNSKSKW